MISSLKNGIFLMDFIGGMLATCTYGIQKSKENHFLVQT